jgi:DNA-binding CsgD family transcriptional regulator
MTTLDHLAMGVLMLDRNGRVIHRNRAGIALTAQRTALWIDPEGRPRGRLRHEDNALQRLISGTTDPRSRSAGGSVALHGDDSRSPLHLLVGRLGAHGEIAPGSGEAVIFFSDPGVPARASEAHLGAIFGFTPAQARLVCALVAGEAIGDYAQRTGINLETARSHLNHSFAKAGVRRQQELISLILRSPSFSANSDAH